MKNVYENTSFLDNRAITEFQVSRELLMENAASGLEVSIDKYARSNSVIIIVCGPGDNGGDGLALARRIIGKYNVKIFMPFESKSNLCKLQLMRLQALNPTFIDKLFLCDIVVDCLFGSNFRPSDNDDYKNILKQMNSIARVNIACDIPSGILSNGVVLDLAFKANTTLSMGALKLAYFSDEAKDYIGEIIEVNLGISRFNYEVDSKYKLLTKSSLKLPSRKSKNVHKGNFGHSCIIAGEKEGACVISALSALAFGSGLVSIIGDIDNLPFQIMKSKLLPKNCNAIAFGMGLGDRINKYNFDFLGDIPSVIDADMFYFDGLSSMLEKGNIVLTPHINEFASLLKITKIGDFEKSYIIKNRFKLCMEFSSKYPNIVLLLKGANTLIVYEEKIYINNLGVNNLAKAGSGDVLSGMIVSLLSQGYSLIESSISASLAHSLAASSISTSYGLDPLLLIDAIRNLE